MDPLAPKYPHNGPYNFSGNHVVHTVELEGLEPDKDANDVGIGEVGQGSDKSTDDTTVYNWFADIGSNGNHTWIKKDQYSKPLVSESAEISQLEEKFLVKIKMEEVLNFN